MFNWTAYLTYVLVCGITPGPNNIIALTNGSRLGFRRGFSYNLGLLAAQCFLLTLCMLACRALNTVIPQLVWVMKFVGAAYILYLAWKIFRSSAQVGEGETNTGFWRGVLLQFINPKLYLYVLVSAESYILPVYQGRIGVIVLFSIGMACYSFFCVTCWLGFGSAFRRLMLRHGRLVNTVLALLLVYCAVSLFL